MTVKITISVDEQIQSSLKALAKKKKNSVSGLISELIKKESQKEKIPVLDQGLGSLLRPGRNILKKDAGKDYRELLGRILEEKHRVCKMNCVKE